MGPSNGLRRRLASTFERVGIKTVVIPGLILALIIAIAPAFLSSTGGWIDGIRDRFRNDKSKRVDDLREYLQSSDLWVGEPTLMDRSFNYLTQAGASLTFVYDRVAGPDLVFARPEELAGRAPQLNGTPVLLVAYVRKVRIRSTHGDAYTVSELTLEGARRGGSIVYAGIQGDPIERDGGVLLLRGVVTAVGRTNDDGRVKEAAYYTVLSSWDGRAVQEPPEAVRRIRALARTRTGRARAAP